MFLMTNELEKYKLHTVDGTMGHVADLLLEESTWTIRYAVVETGPWLFGKKVLISPVAFGKADWKEMEIYTELTEDQVKNAPDYASDEPVSRVLEQRFHEYYNWPKYWTGGALWGGFRYPYQLADAGVSELSPPELEVETEAELDETELPALRSVNEMVGYHVQAKDGEVGHIEGFMVETDTWTMRYCVVDTRNWLPGKSVLISPQWIQDVDWFQQSAVVALSRREIKLSPEYDPSAPFTRDDEIKLHDHYGRPFYWSP